VPWRLNRQWLDLVARSGTALFTSWKRSLAADPEVARALGAAWKTASRPMSTAAPLDWMETPRPRQWRFGDGCRATYGWE
jgi:alpha-galactosidase